MNHARAMRKLADRFPRKRVLITGATHGLGEALALRFAEAGFRVAIASRDPVKVAATAAKVNQAGGEALAITLDVTRVADFAVAAEQVAAAWDGLDILVNNAGILSTGKVADIGLQQWQQSLDTDLWSVIHGCRLLLPLLGRSGAGHLVNVASMAGLGGGPGMASYCVAKAGVVSLSQTLAVELAERNIDVTVCCPTVFRSHLIDSDGHDPGLITGVAGDGLRHEMQTTSISSDDVAVSLIRSMARRRLYDVPQRDARFNWWLARMFPESYRHLVLYLYRHRLWVFNDGS
jgi:NAD(P)-dependent dehydrogenase (short-subunit alcohol dehydrogenase family)